MHPDYRPPIKHVPVIAVTVMLTLASLAGWLVLRKPQLASLMVINAIFAVLFIGLAVIAANRRR